MDTTQLFPTSVVGSMPRSMFVKDLIFGDSDVSGEDYQRRLDAAIRFIVALQEQAGIDVVTDGEWRRKSYIGVIAELAHGFELSRNQVDGRPMTVVVDKLAPKDPGFIAREIEFVQSITTKQIKATLPRPKSRQSQNRKQRWLLRLTLILRPRARRSSGNASPATKSGRARRTDLVRS